MGPNAAVAESQKLSPSAPQSSGTREGPSPLRSATTSLIAAVSVCGLLHPFDLVKTRMQVAEVSQGAIPLHRSSFESLRKIYGVEGTGGLYKGIRATLIASGVSWGVFRYIFDVTRNDLLKRFRETKPLRPHACTNLTHSQRIIDAMRVQQDLWANIMAGIVAGFASTCLVHPLWLVKARLEMQAAETAVAKWHQYRGWAHCLHSIYRLEGASGLYKGISPALALAPHAAIQICIYEELKRRYGSKKSTTTSSSTYTTVTDSTRPFFWGAISKFIAVCLTYPLQVVRSRQQMFVATDGKNQAHHPSFTIRGLFTHYGVRTWYRGFGTHIQRSCIYNGLMFFVFERLTALNAV